MISSQVFTDDDGWTIRTEDGSTAAHVEHTIKSDAECTSDFDGILNLESGFEMIICRQSKSYLV
jgi:hypothetical protein